MLVVTPGIMAIANLQYPLRDLLKTEILVGLGEGISGVKHEGVHFRDQRRNHRRC